MKIAVYGICKNEEKFVADWLDNVKNADQIILVDTGSTDDTLKNFWDHAHLMRYSNTVTASINVLPFRFDIARNAALSFVPPDMDVCISLDMDERLIRNWRQILELEWKPGTDRLNVEYVREGLQPFAINTRIHARAGYYWREPCHEGLYPWMRNTDNIVDAPMFKIFHYPDSTKSRSQYAEMLAYALDEEPWNLRRMFYYAREMLMMGNYETARGWLQKYIEIDTANEIPAWYENTQARALLQLCEGVIKETAERQLATDQPTPPQSSEA